MKKFIESLKNIWKIEELKNKIFLTLGLLLVYRFGTQVTLPGIDATKLQNLSSQTDQGIGWLINVFTGGAFSQASVFALGIMPYISASIVVQLLGIAVPSLQKLQKDGESGRKKINQITRWLTIGITLLQGPGYIYNLYKQLPPDAFILGADSFSFLFSSVVILTTGTVFAMWLGEKITDKGIGNGISLLIMVGILARLPQSFIQEFTSRVSEDNGGPMMIVFEILLWLLVIVACILLTMAVRKIPVQYAKKVVGRKLYGGQNSHIPMKVNQSGVMPIIFASSLLAFPQTIALFMGENAQNFVSTYLSTSGDIGFWIYRSLEVLLIVFFSYFYTTISFNVDDIAENMKNNGGFIPGIRPGRPTIDYLSKILSRITLAGALFLAVVAMIPAFTVHFMQVNMSLAGTSILIVVGVALELKRQLESHLVMRSYQGFLK